MPIRVLLVASRPERGRALHRLSRLVAAAWREHGASVHVTEPGSTSRSAVNKMAPQADLVHVVDLADAPLVPHDLNRTRAVVHCHDATDLVDTLGPGGTGRHRLNPLRRAHARSVLRALARADQVLAPTEHTCAQVAEITGRGVELLRPAADPALRQRPGRLDAWKPPTWPYLLTVGGSRPDDRREAAIHAWANLRRTQPLDGASLVVVGPELTEEEENLATGCGGYLTVMSDLTDAQLAVLYEHSRALLCLGRPRGFVWSIAEAHQAGRPVLATDHPVFEEVGQSGCVYLPVEGITRFDSATWACIAEDLTARVVADRAGVNAERFAWHRFVERLPEVTGMAGPLAQSHTIPVVAPGPEPVAAQGNLAVPEAPAQSGAELPVRPRPVPAAVVELVELPAADARTALGPGSEARPDAPGLVVDVTATTGPSGQESDLVAGQRIPQLTRR